MNISNLTIEDLFETFGVAVIIIILVKIVYFISLYTAVSKVRYEIEETNRTIREQTERQLDLLERIANVLEREQEPYIIESDDKKL